MSHRSKVLLVDDDPLGLHSLDQRIDLEFVGRTNAKQSYLEEVARLRPDLVLLDLRATGPDGLEAVRRIKTEHPETAVIVLGGTDSKEHLREALMAGASGYITQDASPALLLDVIRAVRAGISMIPTDLLHQSMADLGRFAPPPAVGRGPLTDREFQVLGLLAQGYPNKGISEALNIVEATVKKHVHNIIRKLEVSDRTQAAVMSIKLGLVSP